MGGGDLNQLHATLKKNRKNVSMLEDLAVKRMDHGILCGGAAQQITRMGRDTSQHAASADSLLTSLTRANVRTRGLAIDCQTSDPPPPTGRCSVTDEQVPIGAKLSAKRHSIIDDHRLVSTRLSVINKQSATGGLRGNHPTEPFDTTPSPEIFCIKTPTVDDGVWEDNASSTSSTSSTTPGVRIVSTRTPGAGLPWSVSYMQQHRHLSRGNASIPYRLNLSTLKQVDASDTPLASNTYLSLYLCFRDLPRVVMSKVDEYYDRSMTLPAEKRRLSTRAPSTTTQSIGDQLIQTGRILLSGAESIVRKVISSQLRRDIITNHLANMSEESNSHNYYLFYILLTDIIEDVISTSEVRRRDNATKYVDRVVAVMDIACIYVSAILESMSVVFLTDSTGLPDSTDVDRIVAHATDQLFSIGFIENIRSSIRAIIGGLGVANHSSKLAIRMSRTLCFGSAPCVTTPTARPPPHNPQRSREMFK